METTATSTQRAAEKELLLSRICILKSRAKALETLIEEDRARLELMLSEDNQDKLIVEQGNVVFGSRRSFSVTDPEKLAELIPPVELAREFKPTAAFVDGAKKAKIDIFQAVKVEHPSTFRVERARTKAAREQHAQIIEETKEAAKRAADEVARRLLKAKGASK